MPEVNPPTICPVCGGKIIHKEGVSPKTNQKYSFWGCSNYPRCQFIWRPPPKTEVQHEEIMDALRKLWIKMDGLEKNFKAFTQIFSKVDETKEK
jgi:ssDNA-binding Zn-finger/Zn-ribbon topoisomerase 1